MRQVRSGSHLRQIGNVWYYRRAVPPDVRDVFDTAEVKKSLNTSNRREAEQREKAEDTKFEARLKAARETGPDGLPRDPEKRTEELVGQIYRNLDDPETIDEAIAQVPAQYRDAVIERIEEYEEEGEVLVTQIDAFWQTELRDLVLWSGDPVEWQRTRAEIVALIHAQREATTTEHSLDWALGQWKRTANRPEQTVTDAENYLDEFKACTHLRALAAARRPHLLKWRSELEIRGTPKAATDEQRKARKLGPKTINHRLEIVSAILRTGWRDAEMLAPDISKINLPEPENDRGAWQKEELLKALGLLEPGSGQAWLFLIGLTTSTRIGETIAARKEWYRPLGFIEVPKEFTKMKKPHVVPIIEFLRKPLEAHLETVEDGEFMFDAPRPTNPKLKMSHETSKWFSRFHAKYKIPRVIHELRDTWIDAARHNEVVKKEIYEIITGHSAKTGSDGYGGERPAVLMTANETICKDLLDADLTAAIRRLVA